MWYPAASRAGRPSPPGAQRRSRREPCGERRRTAAEGKARQGRAAPGDGMSQEANGVASGAKGKRAAQPDARSRRVPTAEGKAREGRCKRRRPEREDPAGTLYIAHDVQSR